ncbi:MAG: DNA mismatch repair endonuclease MutL [Myxococcales bacterium]|nr:DNA mismatch repair endonuclease MutL [Myxococcales bacterium]
MSPQNPPPGSARIAVLSPLAIDQIAAGEVVERPASVVKELVDNAMDAGATRVDVELEDGGMTRISVRDNGRGIHPDDLLLAVTRHATSKLRDPSELTDIATLGFRGEALASIAAVARLDLRSRQPSAAVGVHLHARPGEPPRLAPAGMPVGTQVEVHSLFANLPARRKFMRAEATEVGQCSETVLRLALVHPEVHVTLRHGKRELLSLPRGTLGERVVQVLGRRTAGAVFAFSGEEDGVAVQVWLPTPEAASRGRGGPYLIVRRRVVRERSLGQIVAQAYGLTGEATACVWVEPPRSSVDVNVHPQKSEVRFSDPQRVYAAVRRVLAAAVAAAPWAGELAPPATHAGPAWPPAGVRPVQADEDDDEEEGDEETGAAGLVEGTGAEGLVEGTGEEARPGLGDTGRRGGAARTGPGAAAAGGLSEGAGGAAREREAGAAGALRAAGSGPLATDGTGATAVDGAGMAEGAGPSHAAGGRATAAGASAAVGARVKGPSAAVGAGMAEGTGPAVGGRMAEGTGSAVGADRAEGTGSSVGGWMAEGAGSAVGGRMAEGTGSSVGGWMAEGTGSTPAVGGRAERLHDRLAGGAGADEDFADELAEGAGAPDLAVRTGRQVAGYRLTTRALTADYDEHKRGVLAAAAALRPSEAREGRELAAREARDGEPREEHAGLFAPEQLSAGVGEAEAEEGEAPRRPTLRGSGPEFLLCLPGPVAVFAEREALLAVDLRRLRSHLVYLRLQRDLIGRRMVAIQGLLNPAVVHRAAEEIELIIAAQVELRTLGVDVDRFGDDAVLVRGVPAHLRHCVDDADVGDLVARIVPWLRIRTREADASAVERGLLGAIATTHGSDPAPRLARRWLAELVEAGATLAEVPGVRRWTAAALLGARPAEAGGEPRARGGAGLRRSDGAPV